MIIDSLLEFSHGARSSEGLLGTPVFQRLPALASYFDSTFRQAIPGEAGQNWLNENATNNTRFGWFHLTWNNFRVVIWAPLSESLDYGGPRKSFIKPLSTAHHHDQVTIKCWPLMALGLTPPVGDPEVHLIDLIEEWRIDSIPPETEADQTGADHSHHLYQFLEPKCACFETHGPWGFPRQSPSSSQLPHLTGSNEIASIYASKSLISGFFVLSTWYHSFLILLNEMGNWQDLIHPVRGTELIRRVECYYSGWTSSASIHCPIGQNRREFLRSESFIENEIRPEQCRGQTMATFRLAAGTRQSIPDASRREGLHQIIIDTLSFYGDQEKKHRSDVSHVWGGEEGLPLCQMGCGVIGGIQMDSNLWLLDSVSGKLYDSMSFDVSIDGRSQGRVTSRPTVAAGRLSIVGERIVL